MLFFRPLKLRTRSLARLRPKLFKPRALTRQQPRGSNCTYKLINDPWCLQHQVPAEAPWTIVPDGPPAGAGRRALVKRPSSAAQALLPAHLASSVPELSDPSAATRCLRFWPSAEAPISSAEHPHCVRLPYGSCAAPRRPTPVSPRQLEHPASSGASLRRSCSTSESSALWAREQGAELLAEAELTGCRASEALSAKHQRELRPSALFRQYLDLRRRYPGVIIALTVGSFVEFFQDDARIAHHVLKLALRRRSFGAVAHLQAGFPVAKVDVYLPPLVLAGHRVAWLYQSAGQDPREKTLRARRCKRVWTPGTLGPQDPDTHRDNFIVFVRFSDSGDTAGVSGVDLGTGDFWADRGCSNKIGQFLANLAPRELVFLKNQFKFAAAWPFVSQAALLERGGIAKLEQLSLSSTCPRQARSTRDYQPPGSFGTNPPFIRPNQTKSTRVPRSAGQRSSLLSAKHRSEQAPERVWEQGRYFISLITERRSECAAGSQSAARELNRHFGRAGLAEHISGAAELPIGSLPLEEVGRVSREPRCSESHLLIEAAGGLLKHLRRLRVDLRGLKYLRVWSAPSLAMDVWSCAGLGVLSPEQLPFGTELSAGSDLVPRGTASRLGPDYYEGPSPQPRVACLFDAVNYTTTVMGARALRRRLRFPDMDIANIQLHHECVRFFVDRPGLSSKLRAELALVGDLPRIAQRVLWRQGQPRQLLELLESLTAANKVKQILVASLRRCSRERSSPKRSVPRGAATASLPTEARGARTSVAAASSEPRATHLASVAPTSLPSEVGLPANSGEAAQALGATAGSRGSSRCSSEVPGESCAQHHLLGLANELGPITSLRRLIARAVQEEPGPSPAGWVRPKYSAFVDERRRDLDEPAREQIVRDAWLEAAQLNRVPAHKSARAAQGCRASEATVAAPRGYPRLAAERIGTELGEGSDVGATLARCEALSAEHRSKARGSDNSGTPSSFKLLEDSEFGWCISVPNYLTQLPAEWKLLRRWKATSRWRSPSLMKYIERARSAEEDLKLRALAIRRRLAAKVLAHQASIDKNADLLAQLDCFMCFAEAARERGYVQPTMVPPAPGAEGTKSEGPALVHLLGARHPVGELRLNKGQCFVKNDLHLGAEAADGQLGCEGRSSRASAGSSAAAEAATKPHTAIGAQRQPEAAERRSEPAPRGARVMLIFGSNRAGKTTLLKQTACAIILAQAGSWVPADYARLSVFARIIFKSVVQDSIVERRSSFQAELARNKFMLNTMDDRTLVLWDEPYSTTAIREAFSLAWATVEYLLAAGRGVAPPGGLDTQPPEPRGSAAEHRQMGAAAELSSAWVQLTLPKPLRPSAGSLRSRPILAQRSRRRAARGAATSGLRSAATSLLAAERSEGRERSEPAPNYLPSVDSSSSPGCRASSALSAKHRGASAGGPLQTLQPPAHAANKCPGPAPSPSSAAGPLAMVSTHLHGLHHLSRQPGVQCFHCQTKKTPEGLQFTYKLVAGPCNKSYALELASEQLPPELVERASKLAARLKDYEPPRRALKYANASSAWPIAAAPRGRCQHQKSITRRPPSIRREPEAAGAASAAEHRSEPSE